VSQFSFPWGKCYLSPIKDMFTGEIISYDLSVRPDLPDEEDAGGGLPPQPGASWA
jgi:hypothetical protein